jgi:hypothetical protein
MKKVLCLGLLSFATLAVVVQDASAWFFPCCRNLCCRDWCCNRCTTTLCMRPYNAFSPVAYGNICADGCMPINIYGGCLPRQMGASCYAGGGYGYGCGYGQGCYTNGCCDAGALPAPGSFATMTPMGVPVQVVPAQPQVTPTQPMPTGMPGQQFQPPATQPLNPTSYMMPMYGYGAVQPVGYYPGYYTQMPSYWYGR